MLVFKPIAKFGVKGDWIVTFYDSSSNAVTYKLDFGDGSPIITDSLSRKFSSVKLHMYTRRDTSANYFITYKVFNKIGESDTQTKKIIVSALPKDTVDRSQPVGYINTIGQLKGIVDNKPIDYISTDSSSFAGSNYYVDMDRHYYFTAIFTHGNDKCTPLESYLVLIPIRGIGINYLANKPPSVRYNVLKDSLKIGSKYNFTYITSTKQSDGFTTYKVYSSKEKAQLVNVEEVSILSTLYKGVYTKGLDATFVLKTSEYKRGSDNTNLVMNTDITFKVRLLVDDRQIQGVESMISIGFCF